MRLILHNNRHKNALIFIHGNSSDGASWNEQIKDSKLHDNFSLFTVDLPGHGAATRNGDYNIVSIANSIKTEIEQLDLKGYILVGHSLGTCIIGEMGKDLKNCDGFVLVSPNITSNEYHPGTYTIPFPELPAIVTENVDDSMLQSLAERLFFDKSNKYISQYIDTFKKTDGKFRAQLGATIATAAWSDELDNIRSYNKKVAVIFGKNEEILNTHYLDNYSCLWNDKSYYIDDSAHFPHLENPQNFNELLFEYCKYAFFK